jgi:multimeric flavodoxin WrbA
MVNVMKVLGIVGSPHKDGRANKLVTKAMMFLNGLEVIRHLEN